MVICSCNVLSDHAVHACLGEAAGCPRTAKQVYDCLGCTPQCGRCAKTINAILTAAGVRGQALAHDCDDDLLATHALPGATQVADAIAPA